MEESDVSNNMEADAVKGPGDSVRRAVLQISNEITTGNDPGSSDVSLDLIRAMIELSI